MDVLQRSNASDAQTRYVSPQSSSGLLQYLTLAHLISAVFLYVIAYGALSAIQKPQYPTSIPWLGHEGKGWLARKLVRLQSVFRVRDWASEGYHKYNKRGQSFVLPNTPGLPDEIVIPREQMSWLLDQPDDIMSVREAHYETLHGKYAFITPDLIKDPYHERVVHRRLARNLSDITSSVREVTLALDEFLGKDETAWKSANVWDMLLFVVSRTTNRMILGLPISREKTYLDHMIGFTNAVVGNMFLLQATPAALKPVVGRLSGLWSYYHWKQSSKFTLPIIRQRLHDIERKDAGDAVYKDWQPPQEYITWHIRQAQADNRPEELDPIVISQRIAPLNFASNHTTALTGHGTILDLMSSDPSQGFVEALREEAERVWSEEGGVATRDGLGRLYRTDSAIRESMRQSTFATTMVARQVVAKEGITNKAEGWHAPKGSTISVNLYHMAHDEDIYQNSKTYDALRYSREREAWEAKEEKDKVDMENTLRLKQTGLVTTGPSHLSFGHGRHACPGRFFVAHELKIMFSYMFRKYDIKPLKERPTTRWIGSSIVPATDACIEVRRRSEVRA